MRSAYALDKVRDIIVLRSLLCVRRLISLKILAHELLQLMEVIFEMYEWGPN